ncbi:MAG TPA: N-acetyltransferase [Micromonosporaceae bacterium]
MIVRRVAPPDWAAVIAVHTAAFPVDATGMSPEARLVEELRADGDIIPALSLVAVRDDAVVGHVVCSHGAVAGKPVPGLGPLGVLPAHQGRGIGQALMHAVLGAADALDEPAVVLLGSPAYYRRFGFVPAGPLGIESPDPRWGDHFQVRRLTAWYGSLQGAFQYAAAFGRL